MRQALTALSHSIKSIYDAMMQYTLQMSTISVNTFPIPTLVKKFRKKFKRKNPVLEFSEDSITFDADF